MVAPKGSEAPHRTFVLADLAGFTSLTDAHGDETAARTAIRFADLVARSLRGGTRLVKTMGDGVFLVASRTGDAIESLLVLWESVGEEVGFPALRAGIHRGSAVERDGDWFGSGVNVAARLADRAQVGQILCSRPVAQVAEANELAPVADRGRLELRGLADPFDVFELFPGEDPIGTVVDPVCRMRVTTASAQAWIRHADETLYFCSQDCARKFLERLDDE